MKTFIHTSALYHRHRHQDFSTFKAFLSFFFNEEINVNLISSSTIIIIIVSATFSSFFFLNEFLFFKCQNSSAINLIIWLDHNQSINQFWFFDLVSHFAFSSSLHRFECHWFLSSVCKFSFFSVLSIWYIHFISFQKKNQYHLSSDKPFNHFFPLFTVSMSILFLVCWWW